MHQVLFEIPGTGIKIFGYGLMLFFAFLASMNLAAWRARREGLDPETVFDLALWVFLGGMVGARVFYVSEYWQKMGTIWDLFKIWEGGIVLYGSIMGGATAYFLYWAFRRFPMRPMCDVFAPSLALGVAIGRLGCFLNGCCYGDTCNLPWAVTFPQGTPPWIAHLRLYPDLITNASPRSLPVHPTQLYSVLDGFILLLLLSTFYPLRRRDGEVLALLMVTYPITRFLIEYLRNDEGVFYAGMTVSQCISVVLFAGGLLYWAYLSRLPTTRYADTVREPAPTAAVEA